MPTVASSLGTDLIGISWALLAYQIPNIGLSIIFGRVSDLWGREKVFGLGFLVFSLSSLLCGLSLNVMQLILSRFVQGVGGAMLQSSSRALAAESVPEELAGRAQGYMTTAHHVGFVLGSQHRRFDDRLPELALEFLSAGSHRLRRYLADTGELETPTSRISTSQRVYRLPRRGAAGCDDDYLGADF